LSRPERRLPRKVSQSNIFGRARTDADEYSGWKRMITKPTFVGPDFTRRPVKYERFIRPMGLRYKKANVTVSWKTLLKITLY
jgi:ribosome biogenesis protein NSA2